jgi:hypothetical protein
VGDQVVSVAYDDALAILQSTGNIVTLIVSQVFTRKQITESVTSDSPAKQSPHSNLMSTPSKSLPNLLNSRDYQLPKVSAIQISLAIL